MNRRRRQRLARRRATGTFLRAKAARAGTTPRRRARPRPPRRRHGAKGLASLAVAVAVAASIAVLGVRGAARLPLFRVDDVEVVGLRYVSEDEVRALAGLDGRASIWDSKAEWRRGVESHPMIDSVQVARRPPSAVVFRVVEAEPVALVALPLVTALDSRGNPLPIDPSNPVLDLPLLSVPPQDSARDGLAVLAREMEHVAQVAPEVFAVISEAHLDDRLVTFHVGDPGLKIRYAPPISQQRLRDGIVAMNDAIERFPELSLVEVDLRFEDQVVVRTSPALSAEASS